MQNDPMPSDGEGPLARERYLLLPDISGYTC